jgi:hypothetical protein
VNRGRVEVRGVLEPGSAASGTRKKAHKRKYWPASSAIGRELVRCLHPQSQRRANEKKEARPFRLYRATVLYGVSVLHGFQVCKGVQGSCLSSLSGCLGWAGGYKAIVTGDDDTDVNARLRINV